MLKTPLTRRSAARVRLQKARADEVAEKAKASSRAVSARKTELLKTGVPAIVLLATGTYFGKRMLDHYRYHRKIEKFEAARERDKKGTGSMSAEELAAADDQLASGLLTLFDVLNVVIAALVLFHRARAATETSKD